jgi:starch synthase
MIHNLFYQGMFDHRFVSEMDFDAGQAAIPSFFNPRLLKLNTMRRGIMHSDLIITVSPTYAKEITTSDYGELLDKILRERRSRLYGVLNGIDYKVFNPTENPNIFKHYDVNSLDKRPENKLELQKRFGLRQDKNIFMLAIISRLVEQKGFDILMPVAESLLNELGFQLMVLGSGDSKYMGFFQDLEKRFQGQVACHLIFDRDLPHLVYAASDAILIPSRFEPSGLNQMEAMAYAAVPIVRSTGGLADSVEDYDPKTPKGTGFIFKEFNPMSLVIAVTRAFEIHKNPLEWQELQKRCLKKDFSWKRSAEEYSRLFHLVAELIKKERAI